MNILNKLTLKNLKLNKKRSIVTIIGIILSVALITAVSSMVSSFKSSMINYEKEMRGNYHYIFSNVPSTDLQYFENSRYFASYSITKEIGYAKLTQSANEYKPYAYIIEMDKQSLKNTGIILKEGRLPENSNEIVIPRHLKTNGRIDYKVGDTITLEIGTRESNGEKLTQENPYSEENQETINSQISKQYKIVGIVERPSFEPHTAPGYTFISYLAHRTSTSSYIVYTKYTQKALKDESQTTANILGIDPDIYKKGISPQTEEDFDNYYQELAKAKYHFSNNSRLIKMETMSFEDGTMRTIYSIAIIIIIIIIATSVFCIKNSFNISINEKIKQYGMLSSIGATSKQIKKNVYYEAFLLATIGIPLGILSGLFASYILIIVVDKLIGSSLTIEDFLKFKISILPLIISIILSSITIHLSAKKSAKIASLISPIKAIRNSNDLKITEKDLKTPKIINKIFGIGGVVSYKNIKRNHKKYRPTVISIIVCTSVYIALSYFVNMAFDVTKLEYGEYSYNINVGSVLEDYNKNYELLKKIVKLDNINSYVISKKSLINAKNVKMSKESIANGNIIEESKEIIIISLGDDAYKAYLKKLNLNYNNAKDKAILVSNTVQKIDKNGKEVNATYDILDYKQGDTINGTIDIDNASEDYTFTIIKSTNIRPMGYENNYGMIYLIVSDELIDTIPKYNQIVAYINSSNPDTLQDQIDALYEEENINDYYFVNNIDASIKTVNSFFTILAIFLYGFIIVIALIGITNIFNTISTNMNLRSSEFATLKSIGMTSKEFNRMIFLESFFYCIKSLLIGIPIGISLSYLVYLALKGEMIFKYTLPYKGIIISICIVFILVFTLMKYSVNKTKNKNIIETIRNENI